MAFTLTFRPDEADGYAVSRAAAACRCLLLVSPLLAAWTAWRSHDLRAFLETRRSVRRRSTALLRMLWPLPLAPVIALLAMLALLAGVAPWDPAVRWMSITAVAALLSSFVLGAAAGQALPRAIAVPSVAVGLFLWHAVPSGIPPYWLRYANASFVTCCTTEQQVSDLVYRASIAVAAVWSVGCLALLALRLTGRLLLMACGVVVAAGLAGGQLLVGPHPPALAVQERAERPVCAQAENTVCVWPENASQLAAEAALIREVQKDLENAGVNMPRVYSESPLYPAGALRIEIASSSAKADRIFTIALSLLPNPEYCTAGGPDAGAIHSTYNEVLYWLSRKSGMTASEVESRLGPAQSPELAATLSRDDDFQRSWYLDKRQLLAAKCST
ncbi:DUF7224 domain-containing protein [Micromonospora arida]|uniref:DUF7224 domain-containing protein n=1 Tax=Micromonospora arida TaxID=2203715 RepID=UPI00339F6712